MLFTNHSYRNASTGSTLAALRAGKNPASNPIIASKKIDTNRTEDDNNGLPRKAIGPSLAGNIQIIFIMPIDKSNPIEPPMKAIKRDSKIN